MMKKRLAVLLCGAMLLGTGSVAFAEENTDKIENILSPQFIRQQAALMNIDSEMPNEGEVVKIWLRQS